MPFPMHLLQLKKENVNLIQNNTKWIDSIPNNLPNDIRAVTKVQTAITEWMHCFHT